MNDNKKTIIILVVCIISLLLIVGGSYALWAKDLIGGTSEIKISDAEIKYLESDSNVVNIQDAFPLIDEVGKKQDDTFDFEVSTKTSREFDMGYSLVLEKLGVTLCSDVENPNKEDYPSCYEKTIPNQVKEFVIQLFVSEFGLDAVTATEFYDAVLAHDDDEMRLILSEAGLGDDLVNELVIGIPQYGYENFFLMLYEDSTGTSVVMEYEFNGNNTLGKLCNSISNPTEDSNPECYNYKYKNILIDHGASMLGLEDVVASQLYDAIYEKDDEKILEVLLDSGMSNDNANYALDLLKNNGYIEALIKDYETTSGVTFDRTMDFFGSNMANVGFLKDDEVKVYIEDYEGNVVVEPTKISEFKNNDYILYEKINAHDGDVQKISDKYKLRVWIDESVKPELWDEDIDLNYNFRINVKTKDYKKVKVNVSGGSVDGDNEKFVFENDTVSFNIVPTDSTKTANVSCTNNQVITFVDNVLTISNVSRDTTCMVIYPEDPEVSVVVQNGVVDGDSSKVVKLNESVTFGIIPNEYTLSNAIVKCTNNQVGVFENNILTVSNVTDNSICTVKFADTVTTLYEDGTFIINEKLKDREANTLEHGSVTNEYEAFSPSQSYTFTSYEGEGAPLWINEASNIISVEIGEEITPASTAYWFAMLTNMTYGDLSNINTSETIDMSGMFLGSGASATQLNLTGMENWDVSRVANMNAMFVWTGLNSVTNNFGDISNWDTSSVIDMKEMFSSSGLISLGDISNWDTSNVIDMHGMFYESGMRDFGNLANWDVSSVVDMSNMFFLSSASAGLDLSNWNTKNVINMSAMFSQALVDIGDISGWDVSKVENMGSMFYSPRVVDGVWNIGDLSNWNTSSVTNMMEMLNGVARYATTTFHSIGTLNIPVGCDVSDLLGEYDSNFIGNFRLNGKLTRYDYMLRGAATGENARINLYYTNSEAEAIVDELITLYGPNGTSSQGNIYKMESES